MLFGVGGQLFGGRGGGREVGGEGGEAVSRNTCSTFAVSGGGKVERRDKAGREGSVGEF